MKFNLTDTENTDSRAYCIDPCVAPAASWFPVLLAKLAQATRHEGSRRTVRHSTSLRATPHKLTHIHRGRARGPLPSQHTPSHSITTTDRDLNTLAQGRT